MRNEAAVWTAVSASLVAMFTFGPASAQDRQVIKISSEGANSRYVQQHMIDVDDVPGHQIRVQESMRSYPVEKQFAIDGERVTEWWIRSFSNYTNGVGPSWGFSTWLTEKGNKIFIETTGTSESQVTDTGAKRGTYHGTSRIVGGTGRFSKLRGMLVDVARFDTDPKGGYSLADSHGDYWFER